MVWIGRWQEDERPTCIVILNEEACPSLEQWVEGLILRFAQNDKATEGDCRGAGWLGG